jgi:hypothetical protein
MRRHAFEKVSGPVEAGQKHNFLRAARHFQNPGGPDSGMCTVASRPQVSHRNAYHSV